MTEDEIIEAANLGAFIADPEYQCFADLDGKEARKYLETKGLRVVQNLNTGRNGLAITSCGIYLSTNGYIHRK